LRSAAQWATSIYPQRRFVSNWRHNLHEQWRWLATTQ